MPLDRTPKAAKPWVPELLFDPVPPPQAPVAPVQSPAAPASSPPPEELLAEATASSVALQEPAAQPVEAPAPLSPAIAETDDPIELRRILADQEKALNKVRILRRNLQEEISKAKRAFMFAERSRLYSAKGAVDALVAQEQQGELDERRLTSDIMAVRTKLGRSQR